MALTLARGQVMRPNPEDRFTKIAHDLRHRIRSAGWWRHQMLAHPGGLASQVLASRMLNVSPNYVYRLGKVGSLTVVRTPPAINCGPLYVVDELWCLGTALERGKPKDWSYDEQSWLSGEIARNEWGPPFDRPTVHGGHTEKIMESEKISRTLNPLWMHGLDGLSATS